ncbi:MAG: PAS domain-containing protein [Rickettsiales bacterium]
MSELHHRSHEILQDYWDKVRADKTMPAEGDIDPDDIADIWSSCFLICIDEVTQRIGYRYSYMGDKLIEAYGDDVSNPDVAERLISTGSLPIIKKFDEAVSGQKPVTDESEFVNLKGLNIRYRTCILPLGQDGKITHLLGCMRWKLY